MTINSCIAGQDLILRTTVELLHERKKMKTLPDITEAKPLGSADKPLVDELVALLKKHNALDRFGITLLHQHFPISEDEVLVENVDTGARTQLIRPMKKNELGSLNYTETSWRLDSGEPMMACVCVKSGDDHSHQSRGRKPDQVKR